MLPFVEHAGADRTILRLAVLAKAHTIERAVLALVLLCAVFVADRRQLADGVIPMKKEEPVYDTIYQTVTKEVAVKKLTYF